MKTETNTIVHGKTYCPDCNGEGKYIFYDYSSGKQVEILRRCNTCKGHGRMWKTTTITIKYEAL
jgi:DnaJ-class molecular chaperone